MLSGAFFFLTARCSTALLESEPGADVRLSLRFVIHPART